MGRKLFISLLLFVITACELVDPPTPPNKSGWDCKENELISGFTCEGYNGTYTGEARQRTMSDGSRIPFGEELYQIPIEDYSLYFEPHGRGEFKRKGNDLYLIKGSFSNNGFYNGRLIEERENGGRMEQVGEFDSSSNWVIRPSFTRGTFTRFHPSGKKELILEGDFVHDEDSFYLSRGTNKSTILDQTYTGIGIRYRESDSEGVEIISVDSITSKESDLEVGDIVLGIENDYRYISFEELSFEDIGKSFKSIQSSSIDLFIKDADSQKRVPVRVRPINFKGCTIITQGQWDEDGRLSGKPAIIEHPNGIVKANLKNGEIDYGNISIEYDPNRESLPIERSPRYKLIMGIDDKENNTKDRFSAKAYFGSRSSIKPSKSSNNLLNLEYKVSFNISKGDNSIVEGEVEWVSISTCDSEPKIIKENIILGASDKRYLVNESPMNFRDRSKLDFKDYDEAPENWNKDLTEGSQIIYVEVLESGANREVTRQESIQSTYRVGYREVYNEDYDRALIAVQRARDKVYSEEIEKATRNTQCGRADSFGKALLCSVIDNAGVASAESNLEEAIQELNSTSRVLNEPIMEPYMFNKNYVKATKETKIKISLIDHTTNTYKEKIVTSNESKQTVVLDRDLPQTDPKIRSHERDTMTEEELDKWIDSKPMPDYDSLESLIKDVSIDGNKKGFRTALNNITTKKKEKKEKKSDKGIARSKNKDSVIDYADSVVVIEDLRGSSGAGFYIRDQLIMTNAHVVEDKKYLNIKSESGESFIGEVLMKDLSSDLAVINVKRKGLPIKTKPGCSVRRGEEVVAIGHPEGFDFSLTKGIVSGLRTKKLFTGGKSVRVIQIDANITYGNSGGPLIDNDGYLIGVNSYGEGEADFLDFSIHCSEVEKFLQEYIP
tara:strand:- start:3031 stop:5709 length:2679 start_codon:yes stop_codon:yes gene_type:complete